LNYTPKEFPEDINVTPVHPLTDFLILCVGFLGLILITYVLLGSVSDYLVGRLSMEQEHRLAKLLTLKYKTEQINAASSKLQAIVDRISSHLNKPPYPFSVQVICDPTVNALALPGGRILVLSGLLKMIGSENELAMVLAHEMGHYQHRDHLRGLGRALVFLFLTTLLSDLEGSVSQIFEKTGLLASLRFNQRQETEADNLGLELVQKTYGHVGGATTFFKTLAIEQPEGPFGAWFSSHPASENRAQNLELLIQAREWKIKPTVPLAPMSLNQICKESQNRKN